MLRTLLQGCGRAYTCTCLHGPSAVSKIPRTLNGYILSQNTGFHSTTQTLSLEKELKGKKRIIRAGQLAKEEHLEEPEEASSDLTGLSEAGVTIPTLETHQMLVNGVPYSELPIVHIKSSLNNTLMTVTDHAGSIIAKNSCGMEGFKHVKKSTNVAAQATGLSLGLKSIKLGVTTVRVTVRGIGAGRLASMKGLQMAGLKIVSITDETPIPHNGCRPRKARRL